MTPTIFLAEGGSENYGQFNQFYVHILSHFEHLLTYTRNLIEIMLYFR